MVTGEPLHDSDVHVWWAELSHPHSDYSAAEGTLCAAERQRANEYRVESVRQRFVRGRGMLRLLLARYLAVDPAAIRFSFGALGKPSLHPCHRSDVTFSVSHSDGVAVYAIGKRDPIGVDVEHVRPIACGAIVDRFFSRPERALFRALPRSQQLQAFFLGWTRKEAYLKACGAGLTTDLAAVEVTLLPGAPPRILSAPVPTRSDGWWLANVPAAAGVVGSLAIDGSPRRLITNTLDTAELSSLAQPL